MSASYEELESVLTAVRRARKQLIDSPSPEGAYDYSVTEVLLAAILLELQRSPEKKALEEFYESLRQGRPSGGG